MFCEKGAHKNFPDFTGKHMCWSLFLVKLQVFPGMQICQKRDSNTGFFVKFINTYFEEHLRATASKLLFREKPHWLNIIRFIDIANTFDIDRSSRPKLFKKSAKLTIKQQWRRLVLKKAACRRKINERLLHRYFPVSFPKFFRTLILKNLWKWMLTVWK